MADHARAAPSLAGRLRALSRVGAARLRPRRTGSAAPDHAQKPSTTAALAVFFERRMLVMLALGFAAGLPNLLIFDTLSAWLRQADVPLRTIGFFSLATLAYSLKFLWAPLVDRIAIPLLTPLLGQRRGWMLMAQAVVILGLWLVSGSDPAANLWLVAAFAVLVAFASATQDVVIDAWRIEAAGEERQGAMAAMYQWGYRIAILTAGIAPLMLAKRIDWSFAYAAMAALMAIGVAAVFAAPRERPRPAMPPLLARELPVRPAAEALEWIGRLSLLLAGAFVFGVGFTGQFVMVEWAAAALGMAPDLLEGANALWSERPLGVLVQVGLACLGLVLIVGAALPLPGARTRPSTYFVRSYGDPLRDFFSRFRGTAGLILAMICCYRLSDFVLNIMNPFYLDLGFDLDTIAEVRKGVGVAMLMLGVGAGGWSIARFGLMRSLIIGALAGPVSNLVFAWLATQGPDPRAFALAITVDNVSAGYAGTILIAYMSSLTSAGFTATQYALFSSLYSLPGKLIAAQSGAIVEASARMAAPGGPFAGLTALFSDLPAVSFAAGAADLGVSAAALAAGYAIFFLYSCLVGLAALVLALVIAGRPVRNAAPGERATSAP
ncbi:MAG TPA: MFS transporter [Geminicoccaceae bacterium]|nr:MFS transporter [Geminicoccaceae bacterium]